MEKRYPSCILASCCIPWDADYSIMEPLFREEIRGVVKETPHVYILGTAGEGYALSDSQFNRVVKIFNEEMRAAGAEPMVGLISLASSTLTERLERCLALDIKHFQISLPSWGALSVKEMQTFFKMTCGAYPEAGFLHYNLERARRLIQPEEYQQLEEQYPNLIATKITTDSIRYIGQLMDKSTHLQHFFTDMGYLYAAMVGECGLLISMACCNWETAHEYVDAVISRDFEKAIRLQHSLVQFNGDFRKIIAQYGQGAHIDGAYDKLYIKMQLPDFPLRLAPPYSDAGDGAFIALLEVLKQKYPQWYPNQLRQL